MFHDLSSLHAYYVMDIYKLCLILTHLLPHITCFASNLRHKSFKFNYPKNCFIMKLSVALTTFHCKDNQGINQVSLGSFKHSNGIEPNQPPKPVVPKL